MKRKVGVVETGLEELSLNGYATTNKGYHFFWQESESQDNPESATGVTENWRKRWES